MLADMTAMLLWPTRYEEGAVSEFGRIAYQELNVPCNFTDLVTALTEIRDAIVNRPADDFSGIEVAIDGVQAAINNQDLTVDLSALEPPLTGIQTAIENQVLTVDLSSLETVLTGIQTAIENQVLTVDLSSLETVLTGIQTAIENQVLTVDLTDFQAALTTAINGVQTAIENQETGCTVDFTELELVLAGIKAAIENLSEEDMQIINNMCCGCGCGGSGYGGNNPSIDNLPPDDAPDETLPPLPDIEPPLPTPTYQQFACKLAHFIVHLYRDAVMEISTLVETGEANYSRVNTIIGATLGALVTRGFLQWAVYYFLVTWLINRVTRGAAERMGQAIDQNYEALVCALYSGDGLEDKRDRFRAELDSLALAWADRYWMKLVEQNIPYEVFYTENWENFEFPQAFQSSRECCNDFNDVPFPDQPLADEWVWVYPANGTLEVGNIDGTDAASHISYANGIVSMTKADTWDETWHGGLTWDLGTDYENDRVHGVEVSIIYAHGVGSQFLVENALIANGPDIDMGANASVSAPGDTGIAYIGDISASGVDLTAYDSVDAQGVSNPDNWFGFLSGTNQEQAMSLTFSVRFLVHVGGRV
jgi:hypothetical protein